MLSTGRSFFSIECQSIAVLLILAILLLIILAILLLVVVLAVLLSVAHFILPPFWNAKLFCPKKI